MNVPVSLGGDYVLTDVRRRVRARGARVADCPVCGGYLHEDAWHLSATVARAPLGRDEAVHHLCDVDCFEDWLALLMGTRDGC